MRVIIQPRTVRNPDLSRTYGYVILFVTKTGTYPMKDRDGDTMLFVSRGAAQAHLIEMEAA